MNSSTASRHIIEFGDFQTPAGLAHEVCAVVARYGLPGSILEPTCGKGAFLQAAEAVFRNCSAFYGYEINSEYVAEAKSKTSKSQIVSTDFFAHDWSAVINRCSEPIYVIGNPPWVTNASMGSMGGTNLPAKTNVSQLKGLESKTGKSNFDISEYMINHLLGLLSGKTAVLAVLCKTTVARKVLQRAWTDEIQIEDSAMYRIDAARWFGVSVDACLLVCSLVHNGTSRLCNQYPTLRSSRPIATVGMVDNLLIADVNSYQAHRHLHGASQMQWRSGIKHDCSRVMVLKPTDDENIFLNEAGEEAHIESKYLYPLLKGTDIATGRKPSRYLLVPQTCIGEDTSHIEHDAPLTWQYLTSHADLLSARKSSIYHDQPPYSIFGVGPYSFTSWKVAISGFHKTFAFKVVPPYEGRPVMLDDTSYFLSCQSQEQAEALGYLLNSEAAANLLKSFVFWDAKRPITGGLLSQLDIEALSRQEAVPISVRDDGIRQD